MKLLIYITFIFSLGSCITQEKCLQRFPPQQSTETTTIIEYKDTIIEGGTVERIIQKDSFILLPGEVRTYIDTSNSAVLTFYRNAYGQLVASCEAKDKKIEKLNKETSKVEIIEKIHEKEVRYIPWWVIALLSVTTLFAIPTIFKSIKFVRMLF